MALKEKIRLQKFLALSGVASRRKAEEIIKSGRVRVDGKVVTEMGVRIIPDSQVVHCDNRLIEAAGKEARVYILLNKPGGYVTTVSDPQGRPIVTSLLKDITARVYPVGRLDLDTEGALLMTNDGNLHHHLLHPSFDHEKEYVVTVAKPISDSALARMEKGIIILGDKTRPAIVNRLSSKRFLIQLKEGKNRQIRRMVKKTGNHVIALKRIRVANITLGDLAEGAWRHLTKKETHQLLKSIAP